MELDKDPLVENYNFKSASKVLKAVAIPQGNLTIDGPVSAGRRMGGTSPSSLSSFGSSTRGQSSEYDTPGTSAAATPAEPAARSSSSLAAATKSISITSQATSKVSATARAEQLRTSKLSLNGSITKRKRQQEVIVEDDLDVSPDAQLARALQEEEYQGGNLKRVKVVEFKDHEVGNSSDDSDGLSSLSSLDVPIRSRQNTKRGTSFLLPSRAARDSAKKSIKEKAIIVVSDTEKSDLSVLDSDEFQTEASDFESNEDSSDEEIIPTASENPVAVVVATTRRRRRTTTRVTASSAIGRPTVRSRMSHRVRYVSYGTCFVALTSHIGLQGTHET